MNWKKGDIAICINTEKLDASQLGRLPALRLRAEYLVSAVHKCECGMVSLDVGMPLVKGSGGVSCVCGAKSSPNTGVHWCGAKRFVKRKPLEEQIAEAVENEDYELAEELKNNG